MFTSAPITVSVFGHSIDYCVMYWIVMGISKKMLNQNKGFRQI